MAWGNRIGKALRTNVIVGLVLVTPIVATGFIIHGLFNLVTNLFLSESLRQSEYVLLFRAGAFAAALLLLFLIGLLARNFIGRRLYHLGDLLLTRIPVINKVYVTVRQISEALVAQSQTMFKEAVLLEYPRRGIYSIAFVTSRVPPHVAERWPDHQESEPRVSLFVPTTPNPTSGVLVFAPRSELTPLPMSVPDAMKLVVSAGVAYPGNELAGPPQTLLTKLEGWLLQQRGEADTQGSPGNPAGKQP